MFVLEQLYQRLHSRPAERRQYRDALKGVFALAYGDLQKNTRGSALTKRPREVR